MKGILVNNGSIGYMDIPKCACTSIKNALYEAEYNSRFISDNRIGHNQAHKYRHLHVFFAAQKVSIDIAKIKILVIRDPIERFLSAYSNRISFHLELSEQFVASNYHKQLPPNFIFNPGIGQFLENLEIYKNIPSIEWHTRPISKFIDHNIEFFSHIYKIDELHNLERLLSDSYNSRIRFKYLQTGGDSVNLKHLDSSQIDQLIEYYQEDYHMLDSFYSIDEIWSKWKSDTPAWKSANLVRQFDTTWNNIFKSGINAKELHSKNILFIIDSDRHFKLHWLPRVKLCLTLGMNVHLICSFNDHENKLLFDSIGIKCHEVNFSVFSANPIKEYKQYRSLSRCILSIRPDLIHSITVRPNLYSGFIARKLSISNIKHIDRLGCCSFEKHNFVQKLCCLFILFLYRLSHSKNNSCIIFDNTYAFSYFYSKRIVNHKTGHIIKGDGVNTKEFYLSEIKPESIGSILFAARLIRSNGLHDLVEAIFILHKLGINAMINVAGIIEKDHPDAIPQSLITQWQNKGAINFLSKTEDIPEMISNSHMVVLPTANAETIPRILLQGASMGRPLIATDAPGCREIVRHNANGLLVPPNNPKKLADSIQELILSPGKSKKMGLKGRLMVELEFSDKIIRDQTISIQQRMLDI